MIELKKYLNQMKFENTSTKLLLEMPIGMPGEYNFNLNGENLKLVSNAFRRMKLNKNKRIESTIFIDSINSDAKIIIFEDIIFLTDVSINSLMGILIFKDKDGIHEKILNHYSPLIKISTAFIFKKYRGFGLMRYLYQFLIDSGICLMSDEIQYESARKMWLSLNDIENYKIDFVNIEDGTIIKSDIKIGSIYNKNIWHLVNSEPEGFKARDLGLKYIFERLIIYKRS